MGLIPKLCQYLINKRANVRKELKGCAKGSSEYGILNSIQLLIKVMANAVYGGLGQ